MSTSRPINCYDLVTKDSDSEICEIAYVLVFSWIAEFISQSKPIWDSEKL